MIWLNESRYISCFRNLNFAVSLVALLESGRASLRLNFSFSFFRWSHIEAWLCLEVSLLVRDLKIRGRVAVNPQTVVFGVKSNLNCFFCFGLAESLIHHVLVIVNKRHFALEPGIIVILTTLEVIRPLWTWGHTASLWLGEVVALRVMTQLVEVCSFSMTGTVQGSESTVVLGYVGISTTTIVSVDNWLGVDMSKSFSGALSLDDKCSYAPKW